MARTLRNGACKFSGRNPTYAILVDVQDDTIKGARVQAEEDGSGGEAFAVAPGLREDIAVDLAAEGEEAGKEALEVVVPEKELHSFEINPVKVWPCHDVCAVRPILLLHALRHPRPVHCQVKGIIA